MGEGVCVQYAAADTYIMHTVQIHDKDSSEKWAAGHSVSTQPEVTDKKKKHFDLFFGEINT